MTRDARLQLLGRTVQLLLGDALGKHHRTAVGDLEGELVNCS